MMQDLPPGFRLEPVAPPPMRQNSEVADIDMRLALPGISEQTALGLMLRKQALLNGGGGANPGWYNPAAVQPQ
jgi:hypothetical protein